MVLLIDYFVSGTWFIQALYEIPICGCLLDPVRIYLGEKQEIIMANEFSSRREKLWTIMIIVGKILLLIFSMRKVVILHT